MLWDYRSLFMESWCPEKDQKLFRWIEECRRKEILPNWCHWWPSVWEKIPKGPGFFSLGCQQPLIHSWQLSFHSHSAPEKITALNIAYRSSLSFLQETVPAQNHKNREKSRRSWHNLESSWQQTWIMLWGYQEVLTFLHSLGSWWWNSSHFPLEGCQHPQKTVCLLFLIWQFGCTRSVGPPHSTLRGWFGWTSQNNSKLQKLPTL